MLKSPLISLFRNYPLFAIGVIVIAFEPCHAIVTTTSSSTLTNNQSPPTETDRFSGAPSANSSFLQDPGFLQGSSTSGFDFTGVGQTSSCSNSSGSIGIGICWGTMISPTLFLSATHSHPSDGATVSFYDDAGGLVASRTVKNSSTLSGAIPNAFNSASSSDLWIGELSAAVPTGVAQYPIGTPTVNTSITIQVGTEGPSPFTLPEFRVGQNRLDGGIQAATFDPGVVNRSDFLLYVDNSIQGAVDPANTILTPDLVYETRFQGGDSGGPSFISNGGNLELVGIHSFITDLGIFTTEFDANGDPIPMSSGTAVRRGSADVRVASYVSTIDTRVAAAVPEPSAAIFLVLAGVMGGFRSYWRRFGTTQ